VLRRLGASSTGPLDDWFHGHVVLDAPRSTLAPAPYDRVQLFRGPYGSLVVGERWSVPNPCVGDIAQME